MYLLNHNQNRLNWNDKMRKLLLIFVEIIERGTCIVWMWQTGNFNNQLRHKIIDSSWLIISTGSWRWWCRWARCPTAPSPTPRLPSCWPGWRPSCACSPPGGRTTSTHTKHVSSNQQPTRFNFSFYALILSLIRFSTSFLFTTFIILLKDRSNWTFF